MRFLGSLPLLLATVAGGVLAGAVSELLLALITLVGLVSYWYVSARDARLRGYNRWFAVAALPLSRGIWFWRVLEITTLFIFTLNWQAGVILVAIVVSVGRALWGQHGLVPALPVLKTHVLYSDDASESKRPT